MLVERRREGVPAGSIGDECVRMADYAIEDWRKWQRGETSPHAVSLEMRRGSNAMINDGCALLANAYLNSLAQSDPNPFSDALDLAMRG